MVPVTVNPYTNLFSKLILNGPNGLAAPVQSNRTLDRLLAAFLNKDKATCQEILNELSNRDLNAENDEWAYNDFLLLTAFTVAWSFELDTDSLRRISAYRTRTDGNDLTAKEAMEILDSRDLLNSFGTCVRAAAGLPPSLQDFSDKYLTIHLENRESTSPFRDFITEHAIIHLTANAGAETAIANGKLSEFLEIAASAYSRESKFIHALIMVASVAWMISLLSLYLINNDKWKEFLGAMSLIGATIPIPLIIALAWKRQPFLNWYRNMRFKRLGGTKYDDIKECIRQR